MEIVTVTLNPACDYVVELGDFRPETVNKATAGELQCGGKGVNVSLALAQLGLSTRASGFLGLDNANLFETFCQNQGIAADFLKLPGATRVNVKLAVDNKPATDINLPGLPVTPNDLESLIEKLIRLAAPGKLFILSGSLPPGCRKNIYADLTTVLRQGGAEVFLDASGPALAAGLNALPNLAKPNLDELAELAGIANPSPEQAAELATPWLEKGCAAFAVSMGGAGALWLSQRERLKVGPARVKGMNVVGAGDSFLAGLAYSHCQGWTPARSLSFATGVAGHWVEKMNRTAFNRERVEELAAQAVVERLE